MWFHLGQKTPRGAKTHLAGRFGSGESSSQRLQSYAVGLKEKDMASDNSWESVSSRLHSSRVEN